MRTKLSLRRFLFLMIACWVIIFMVKFLYVKHPDTKIQLTKQPLLFIKHIPNNDSLPQFTVKRKKNLQPLIQPEQVSEPKMEPTKTDFEWKGKRYNLDNADELEKLIETINNVQYVRNAHLIPDLSKSGIVLLIQVHKRPAELKILIESLKDVRGIEKCLVVFSHDVILPELNKIVEDIDFCPVMQIFYPYSIQLYDLKGSYPADSKNDCHRDIGIEKAKEIKCNNAGYPDKFKHYRQAKYSQMKLHWLWKIHFVFNNIRILKNFKGMVLRLDNDYYLAPDILHVTNLIVKHGEEHNEKMFIMGNHEVFSGNSYSDRSVVSMYWFTGVGRGMAFTRLLWNEIMKCKDIFCTFDDYNWDWSLHKIVTNCLKGLKVMKPKASRIFHIGRCHGFHKQEECTSEDIKRQVKQYLKENKQFMFPDQLEFDASIDNVAQDVNGYGGWADPRDHKLCKAIVTLSPKDVSKFIQSLK